ncbi:hypothetical protein ACOMICROBIO_LMKGKHOH_03984 [Vibrio sp. B1FIG11]|nr:hypothetical protein ACOMICROBIO_LMKGKHOH_03984 [Vibrio sp. B1FIG11]CAE6962654.1 hypothetical protein ACOMICROBIO_LMKGKHOH_03984 [Vibrio sp. B1FIG11]
MSGRKAACQTAVFTPLKASFVLATALNADLKKTTAIRGRFDLDN